MSIIFSCNSIKPLQRKAAVAISRKAVRNRCNCRKRKPLDSEARLTHPTTSDNNQHNSLNNQEQKIQKPKNQHSHCQRDQRARSTKSRSQTNACTNHKIERRNPNPPAHIGGKKNQSSSSSASESTNGFLFDRFCFFLAGSKFSASSSSSLSSSSSSLSPSSTSAYS